MPQGQWPTILAGQEYTANTIQEFAPLLAWKTLDTSRSTTTTLAVDPDLTLPIAVSAYYRFLCYLDYEGAAAGTGDLTWNWLVPAGTTLRYHLIGVNTLLQANVSGTKLASDTPSVGTNGAGVLQAVTMHGTLFTSTTTGSITLNWAQNTSSGTSTIIHAQSYMMLQRFA